MLRGRGIDAHAANGIDGGHDGCVLFTVLAAATGPNLRRLAMRMARTMCVIVIRLRHQNSPGLLINIP
jgi:hypothetical protein